MALIWAYISHDAIPRDPLWFMKRGTRLVLAVCLLLSIWSQYINCAWMCFECLTCFWLFAIFFPLRILDTTCEGNRICHIISLYKMFIMYALGKKTWFEWWLQQSLSSILSHFKVWFMHGDTVYRAWNQMILLCAWDSGVLCGYAAANVRPTTSPKKMSWLAGLSETKTFDYSLQAMHYAFSVDNRAVFFSVFMGSIWPIRPHAQPFQPQCRYLRGILLIVQTRRLARWLAYVSRQQPRKDVDKCWMGVDFQIRDNILSWHL